MPIEHKVKQGECVSSVAYDHGFFPETIWNDPANAQLKDERDDLNVLYEGDVLVIPDKQLKQEAAATEARHQFRRKGVPEYLEIQLLDENNDPRANLSYTIVIDGEHHKSQTDGNGILKKKISPSAKSGTLSITSDTGEEEYILELGYLNPDTNVTGVQQRLNNLGFDCGAIDNDCGEKTNAAIQDFQSKYQLKQTDKMDRVTQNKLIEMHGC